MAKTQVLFFFCSTLFAQTSHHLDVSVFPKQTTLGSPVTYQIQIKFLEKVSLSRPNWEQLKWGEVQNLTPFSDKVFQKEWKISWILYPFKEGIHQTPLFQLMATSQTGQDFLIELPRQEVKVKSLWNANEQPHLKPFKTIESAQKPSKVLWTIGVLTVIILILLVILILWKRHQKLKLQNQEPILSPKESLLHALNHLQAQGINQQIEHSQYATHLNMIVRRALSAKSKRLWNL